MKDHIIAIMNTASDYLDRGYDVYLEYKIYRYPNHPTLGKKKYRVDVLAIKNGQKTLIEIGYCAKRKLADLKRLCPDAKLVQLTQWKNFTIHKWYNGNRAEPIHLPRNEYWTIERRCALIDLRNSGLPNRKIVTHFPGQSYKNIVGYLYRLRRKGLTTRNLIERWQINNNCANNRVREWLLTTGKSLSHFAKRYSPRIKTVYHWTPEENKVFIELFENGKTTHEILEVFPFRSHVAIVNHSHLLQRKNLLSKRKRRTGLVLCP